MRFYHKLCKGICVFIFFFLNGILMISAEPSEKNDAEYDSVMFGSMLMQVPRVFHAGLSRPKKDGEYAAIDMIVTAPDLTPLVAPPQALGWTNQLTILIEYPRQFRKPGDILQERLHFAGLALNDFSRMLNGCKMYHNIWQSDIVSCDVDGREVSAICSIKDNTSIFPYCKILENIADNATVIYAYSRDYIDLTPTIDRRIHSLFASFNTDLIRK